MPPFNQGEHLPARKASSAGSTDLAAGAEESVPKVLRSCITSQTSYRISQLSGTEGFGMTPFAATAAQAQLESTISWLEATRQAHQQLIQQLQSHGFKF